MKIILFLCVVLSLQVLNVHCQGRERDGPGQRGPPSSNGFRREGRRGPPERPSRDRIDEPLASCGGPDDDIPTIDRLQALEDIVEFVTYFDEIIDILNEEDDGNDDDDDIELPDDLASDEEILNEILSDDDVSDVPSPDQIQAALDQLPEDGDDDSDETVQIDIPDLDEIPADFEIPPP